MPNGKTVQKAQDGNTIAAKTTKLAAWTVSPDGQLALKLYFFLKNMLLLVSGISLGSGLGLAITFFAMSATIKFTATEAMYPMVIWV
jgi:hypothetical protein